LLTTHFSPLLLVYVFASWAKLKNLFSNIVTYNYTRFIPKTKELKPIALVSEQTEKTARKFFAFFEQLDCSLEVGVKIT